MVRQVRRRPRRHFMARWRRPRCPGVRGGVRAGITAAALQRIGVPASVRIGIAGVALLLTATALHAQNPHFVYTADHLAGTMETVGPNFDAGVRALGAADYATAKERFVRAREQLATTVTFWRQRDREDAIQWVRDAITRLDGLDTTLSQDSVDAGAASAQAQEIETTCNACHAVYREQDPATGEYRLKPGAAG